jgi:hypothetical protein
MKNIERKDPDVSPLGHARQVIKIKQGIETEIAKQVTSFIRDTKLKVTNNARFKTHSRFVSPASQQSMNLQSVICRGCRAKDFPVAFAIAYQIFSGLKAGIWTLYHAKPTSADQSASTVNGATGLQSAGNVCATPKADADRIPSPKDWGTWFSNDY